MSLVIRGRGRTTTVKPRRPSPKTKVSGRGRPAPNPHSTDDKPLPKLGSEPRGHYVIDDKPLPKAPSKPKPKLGKPRRKVAPVRGTVNDKPKPRPSRAKASGKRYGARPMSSSPRGRRR